MLILIALAVLLPLLAIGCVAALVLHASRGRTKASPPIAEEAPVIDVTGEALLDPRAALLGEATGLNQLEAAVLFEPVLGD